MSGRQSRTNRLFLFTINTKIRLHRTRSDLQSNHAFSSLTTVFPKKFFHIGHKNSGPSGKGVNVYKRLSESKTASAELTFILSQMTNLDSPKQKEFADDDFKFDKNGRNFSKRAENTVREKEKLLVTSNFSFFHSVFKRLVSQISKNQGLFGKGLTM